MSFRAQELRGRMEATQKGRGVPYNAVGCPASGGVQTEGVYSNMGAADTV